MSTTKLNSKHLVNSLYFTSEEYKNKGFNLHSIVEFTKNHLEIIIKLLKEDLELYVSDNKELVSRGKKLVEFIESKMSRNSEFDLLEKATCVRTLIKNYESIENELIPNANNALIEINEKFKEYKEEYLQQVNEVNTSSTNNLKAIEYFINRNFSYLEYLKRMSEVYRELNKTISKDLGLANNILNNEHGITFPIKLGDESVYILVKYNDNNDNIVGYIPGEDHGFDLYSKPMFLIALSEYKEEERKNQIKEEN